jgi:nitroreductase
VRSPRYRETPMHKHAHTDRPIHELLRTRWSPYGFDARAVRDEDLCSLFEAARWAPSSYNAQPWSFIVGQAGTAQFARVLDCLIEFNQSWARHAPVLAIGLTQTLFPNKDERNHWAEHDLGLAAGNICVEATARGLCVHQMAGILPDRVRTEFAVPESVRPLTALAIGYPGGSSVPEALAVRDATARERKPISAFVFRGDWGKGA